MKYIIYLIVLSTIMFFSYRIGQSNVKETIIERIDTIIKTDTITIIKPIEKKVYITKYVTDTLYTTDSIKAEVNIPIENKVYTDDSTYYIGISGFKASLDTLRLFPRQTTIYKEKVREIKSKQPLFEFKPSIGVGYGIFENKVDVYIGASLQMNL